MSIPSNGKLDVHRMLPSEMFSARAGRFGDTAPVANTIPPATRGISIASPADTDHATRKRDTLLVDSITHYERAVGWKAEPGDLEPLTVALAESGRSVTTKFKIR